MHGVKISLKRMNSTIIYTHEEKKGSHQDLNQTKFIGHLQYNLQVNLSMLH